MTKPTARERVRTALEAVVAGNSPRHAFEGVIAQMIATNVLTQNDARAELEAAVEDGTLPPESLRRLGLDNGAATQPFTDIENTGDATPRRNEAQTQVRLFASPVGGADVPPMFAQPSPVDTDSVWVEPNSLAAN